MPKPKLTPEEKKIIKQEKKIAKKLAAIEKKKQLKRDHLGREVKYGAQTIARYERDWRDMLKKIAVPRMRQELEFAWHNFERTVDSKDFEISVLMDELRDAENQYMHNFKNHLENLDKLMGMFDDRCNELKQDFNNSINTLFEMNDKEVGDIRGNASTGAEYLKTMLHHLELDRKEQERTCRVEYFAKLDEADVKNQLAVQKMRITLEKKYQELFDETTEFTRNYNKQIKERKKDFTVLKTQEDSMNILIKHQFRKIRHFLESIRLLRLKFSDMRQREGHSLADKQSERYFFYNTYATLRKRMDEYQKFDTHQLMRLTEHSNTTLEYLQDIIKKGELILTIAAICRKLETLKEKIMPFPLPTQAIDYDIDKYRLDEEEEENEIVECVKQELELFWQRVGQVFGSFYSLSHEKEWLKGENAEYERKYAAYVDRMRYPQELPKKKKQAPKGGTLIPNIEANSIVQQYTIFKTGKLNNEKFNNC